MLKNKEGALYIQLIHNRKIKLITTRFRLYACEWDTQQASVIVNKSNSESYAYLQTVGAGLNVELKQIQELIAMLEKRGDYTVDELADYYLNHSFNGSFFLL